MPRRTRMPQKSSAPSPSSAAVALSARRSSQPASVASSATGARAVSKHSTTDSFLARAAFKPRERDRLCCAGAPVKHVAHSGLFRTSEKTKPSNPERRCLRLSGTGTSDRHRSVVVDQTDLDAAGAGIGNGVV